MPPADVTRLTVKTCFKFLDPSVRSEYTSSFPATDIYDFSKQECVVTAGRTRALEKAGTVYETIRKLVLDILLESLDENTFTPALEKVYAENKRGLRLYLGVHHTDNPEDRFSVSATASNTNVSAFMEKYGRQVDVVWLVVEHSGFPQDLARRSTSAWAAKPVERVSAFGGTNRPGPVFGGPSSFTSVADLAAVYGGTSSGANSQTAGNMAAATTSPGGTTLGTTSTGSGVATAAGATASSGEAGGPTTNTQGLNDVAAANNDSGMSTADGVTMKPNRLFPNVDVNNLTLSPEERQHFMHGPKKPTSPYGFQQTEATVADSNTEKTITLTIHPSLPIPPSGYSSYVFIQELEHDYVFRNSCDEKPLKNKVLPSFTPEDTADAMYDRLTTLCLRNGIFVPPYATLTYGNKMGSLWASLKESNPGIANFVPVWSATIMEMLEQAIQGGRFTHPLPDKSSMADILRRAQGDGHMALYLLMQYFATQLNPATESKVNTREPPKFAGCKSLEEYTARFKQYCRQRFYLCRHVYSSPELHEMYLMEIPDRIVVPYKIAHWSRLVTGVHSWTADTFPEELRFTTIVERIQQACVSYRVDYASILGENTTRNKVHATNLLSLPPIPQDDTSQVDHVQAVRGGTSATAVQCKFCNRRHDHPIEDCERLVSGLLAIKIARDDPALYQKVTTKHGSSLSKIYQPFERDDTSGDRKQWNRGSPNKVQQTTLAESSPPDTAPTPCASPPDTHMLDSQPPIRDTIESLSSSPAPFLDTFRDFLEDSPLVLHSLSNLPLSPQTEFRPLEEGVAAQELSDSDLLQHVSHADVMDMGDALSSEGISWENPIRDTISMVSAGDLDRDDPESPWGKELFRRYYAHIDHGATVSVVTDERLVHRLHFLSRRRVIVDVGGREHRCTGAGFVKLFCNSFGGLIYVPVFLCPSLASNIISPGHLAAFVGATDDITRINRASRTGQMILENVRDGHDLVIEGKVYQNLLWAGPMVPIPWEEAGPVEGSPWLRLEKLRSKEPPIGYTVSAAVASLNADAPFSVPDLPAGEESLSTLSPAGEDKSSPASRQFIVAAARTRSQVLESGSLKSVPAERWMRYSDRKATRASVVPNSDSVDPPTTTPAMPPKVAPAPIPADDVSPRPADTESLPRRRILRTLFHQRLGHLHLRRLSALHKSADGVPSGLPDHDPCANCPVCLSGKMHRRAMEQSEEHSVTQLYEGLSMDLGFVVQRPDAQKRTDGDDGRHDSSGNISVAKANQPLSTAAFTKLSPMDKYKYQLGINGEMGYLLIRDHLSGAVYGTTIHSKSPPLDFVRRFLQTHHCASPHRFVRLDHGGDLGGSKRLQRLLEDFGYAVQLTAPDSPHQNGLVERINQDVGSFLRTALSGSGLAPKFWPYAFYMFLRVYNVLPHSREGFPEEDGVLRSPFEIVMGRRPDLSRFRTFGCRVWVRPPGGRTKKLIDNTRRGRFLGYKSTTKNCLYLDEQSNEIKEAFHIQFNETFNDMVSPPPNAVALRAIANGQDIPPVDAVRGLTPDEIDTFREPSLNPTTISIASSAVPSLKFLEIDHDVERDRPYVRGIKGGKEANRARAFWKKLLGSFVLHVDGLPCRDAAALRELLSDLAANPPGTPVTITLDPEPYVYNKDKHGPALHLSAEQMASIHALRGAGTQDEMDQAYSDFVTYYDETCADLLVHALGATVLGTPEERMLSRLTRKNLQRLPTWHEWQQGPKGEFAQLDDMAEKGMYGPPVDPPKGAIILRQHWTYSFKTDGTRKARNCCDGSKRAAPALHGEAKTYASCVEQPCMRLFFALAATQGMTVFGADAANAFANSPPPSVPTYVAIDDAYAEWYLARHGTKLDRRQVLPVLHALQGHPESGSLWEQLINEILLGELGFRNTTHERNLYHGFVGAARVLICRQVDDLAIGTTSPEAYHAVVDAIHARAPMVKLGILSRFNGVDIIQRREYVAISSQTYIEQLLAAHGWVKESSTETSASPKEPLCSTQLAEIQDATGPAEGSPEHLALMDDFKFSYRGVLGELIFVFVVGRLDIGYAIVHLSKYANAPVAVHFRALRRIAKYLRATKDWALVYWRVQPVTSLPPGDLVLFRDSADVPLVAFPPMDHPHRLYGFVDAAHATDLSNRRSVSGMCCILAGAAVAFKSKQQDTIATSSTEAEFIAAVLAAKMIKYLRSILFELGFEQDAPTPIFEDNQAAIHMVNSTKPTPRSRHIDIQYYAIQEWKQRGIVTMHHILGVISPPDALTKPLGWVLHQRHCRRMLGHYGPPPYAQFIYGAAAG
jgi:Reverse transcriptase (RNA-dependent DNA polymerase)